MKDNHELSASLKNHCVPKDEAIFRTTQWRSLYKEKMQCKDEEILRAFLIPIEDIIELYHFYKRHTELNITGIRGYFGHNPLDPITPDMNIDMLLVPVTAEGKDVVDAPPEMVLAGGSGTIFDFTKPCPTECDLSSPLHGGPTATK
jgi:hypothetical protein